MPRRGSVPPIDPMKRLDLFEERVDELHDRRLTRDGFGARMEFSATPTQASMKVASPEKDDLDAYLTTLRHFVSDDEPVVTSGILSIAYTHATDEVLRATFAEAREEWSAVQADATHVYRLVGPPRVDPETGEVHSDTRDLLARDVFDLYVNARVFHGKDPAAMELLKTIEDPSGFPMARAMARAMLNDYVVNVHNFVTWLADVIRAARDEGKISSMRILPEKRARRPDASS